MRASRIILAGFLLTLFGVGMCAAATETNGWYQEVRDLYYGIPVQIRYFPENHQLSARVWAYLESIDDVFNDYKTDSEISTVNSTDSIPFWRLPT